MKYIFKIIFFLCVSLGLAETVLLAQSKTHGGSFFDDFLKGRSSTRIDDLPSVKNDIKNFYSRQNFVQDVLGISEKDFAKKEPAARKVFFDTICGKGKDFDCGVFTQPSLRDLRGKLPKIQKSPGSFNVLSGANPLANKLVLQQVDSGSLQDAWGMFCQKKGKKLTMMVASNSNCLETVSEEDIPSNITRYIHDKTQGPAASISAAPGTLLRHYFAFKDRAQGKEWQINLLDELLEAFQATSQSWADWGLSWFGLGQELSCGFKVEVPNGYLKLPADSSQLDQLATFFEQKRELIKIGLHTDISVSHGFCYEKEHVFLENSADRPLINQVFCAALDVGQGTNKDALDVNKLAVERIAKVLLKAQIEATILAAWQNNTDVLVLPLLGCGAFGNNPDNLIEGIEDCEQIIKDSGMRVVLNLFDGNYKKNGAAKALEWNRIEKLIDLTKKMNGYYLEYQQDGSLLKSIVRKPDTSKIFVDGDKGSKKEDSEIQTLEKTLVALQFSMTDLKTRLGKMSEELKKLNQTLVVKIK